MWDTTLNENEREKTAQMDSAVKASSFFEGLFKGGLLTLDARVKSLELLKGELPWRSILSRFMFWSGITLILTGVVFFFAFNWESLHPFIKFAIIQFGIVLSVIASLHKRLPPIIKRALILGACILVGVFLAVFGQAYQTGANSYALFLTWAFLIFPWVLLNNFSPLWAVFLVVGQLGLLLWRNQTGYIIESGPHESFLLLTLINALLLALREVLCNIGKSWLQEAWTRHALLIVTLFFCGLPVMEYVFSSKPLTIVTTALLTIYAIVHVTLIPYFRIFAKDAFSLGLLVLSLCGLLESTVLHYIFNSSHKLQFKNIEFLVIAFATLVIFVLGFFAFKWLAHPLRDAHDGK